MTGVLLAGTVLPAIISFVICGLMIRLGPKDAPDGGRKTQARAVPSAGGTGILAGLASAGAAAVLLLPDIAARLAEAGLVGPLVFTLIAGLLGLADDLFSLPAGRKLGILAAGALLAGLGGPVIETVWLPGWGAVPLPLIVSMAGIALWLFVMANAVNFMDGANGIAMGSTIIMLLALALLVLPVALYAPRSGAVVLVFLLVAAAAALGGFLVWNLPGRLYAGDTGALAAGALLAGAGASVAQAYSIWVPATLALPFLIDVFMTLIWRARRGEALMQAHRDHAYQLFLRAGWSHLRVAALWWAMTAVCALAVLAGPLSGFLGVFGFGWSDGLSFGQFIAVLAAGAGLWLWQRLTLGRRLEAEGR